MKNSNDQRIIYNIDTEELNESGQSNFNVTIPDDVFEFIAIAAALEVEGVCNINGNITIDRLPKLSYKNLLGVDAVVDGNFIEISIVISITYGNNIPDISRNVQKKISSAIYNMTGFEVTKVNVRISDICVSKSR